MSNLIESSVFDPNVYEIAAADKVLGGPAGAINVQATALANRTKFLHDAVVTADNKAVAADSKASDALTQIAGAVAAHGDVATAVVVAGQYKDLAIAAAANALASESAVAGSAAAADTSAQYAADSAEIVRLQRLQVSADTAAASGFASQAIAARNDMLAGLTSIPAVGTHGVGQIVWNSNPVAGGFVGWVCVAGGSPGVWKTFGAISL